METQKNLYRAFMIIMIFRKLLLLKTKDAQIIDYILMKMVKLVQIDCMQSNKCFTC